MGLCISECIDNSRLSDAEEVLLQMALIEKSPEEKVLSVHRLVQAAVMRRLSIQDRVRYFDAAVQILNYGFGTEWEKDTGLYFKAWKDDAWARQEKCLPHVVHLVKRSERYQIQVGNVQQYAVLLRRCTSYVLLPVYRVHPADHPDTYTTKSTSRTLSACLKLPSPILKTRTPRPSLKRSI
jgi:hypothetical protein